MGRESCGRGTALLLLLGRCALGGSSQTALCDDAGAQGDLTVTVSATGNLQPTNEVTVGSEISGTMTQVFVDNNDRVVKGQELARLDKSKLNDALIQSLAQLASAEATVAQTQATAAQTRPRSAASGRLPGCPAARFRRRSKLETATADYSRAEANAHVAQAAVAQVRAQVSSDRTNIAKASIRSPVDRRRPRPLDRTGPNRRRILLDARRCSPSPRISAR